jgi:addiction module HigA family antidote
MASIPNKGLPGRIAPHPGEFLREILDDIGVSQTTFHMRTGMSMQRISEIINGKRGISPETAWILGSAFGQSPKYWLNLQATHDLTRTRPARPIARMPEAVKNAG